MSWTKDLPLKFDIILGARTFEDLISRIYNSPADFFAILKIAERSGIDTSGIGPFTPMNILPNKLIIMARNQDVLLQFIAEILIEDDAKAIHEDVWNLLDSETAEKIYQKAIAKEPSYQRLTTLTVSSDFAHNSAPVDQGGFEKILSELGLFANPAEFRSILEHSEARVVRVDVDDIGQGTGWLVANDIILTAGHVLGKANNDMSRVSVVCDYKVLITSDGHLVPPGRRVKLTDAPVLAHSSPNTKSEELSESGGEVTDPLKLDFALLRLSEPIGDQGLGKNGEGDAKRGHFKLPQGIHNFNNQDGLFILGHPQLKKKQPVEPLKMTLSLPSIAEVTPNGLRVRYIVNTNPGNSGSPVMDQMLNPIALHHAGEKGRQNWDTVNRWGNGFNQGIPLDLIVTEIRKQVDEEIITSLGL